MTYSIRIDRKRFFKLFDTNDDTIFRIPVILKYDPVVVNVPNADYILFKFQCRPTELEQQLIDLALSSIVYRGPAVTLTDCTSN